MLRERERDHSNCIGLCCVVDFWCLFWLWFRVDKDTGRPIVPICQCVWVCRVCDNLFVTIGQKLLELLLLLALSFVWITYKRFVWCWSKPPKKKLFVVDSPKKENCLTELWVAIWHKNNIYVFANCCCGRVLINIGEAKRGHNIKWVRCW